MTYGEEKISGQERWNIIGKNRLEDMKENPERYVIRKLPYGFTGIIDLIRSISPLEGKSVLELGCGWGRLSVFLAKQGAKVTAFDIGDDLLEAAYFLAKINGVECNFQHCSVTKMPFEKESFDFVVGQGILHHLSEVEIVQSIDGTYKVLKNGGSAFFHEPVENSKIFDLIQNVIPLGRRGSEGCRPSILQRKLWSEYIESLDDRCLTNRELFSAGRRFRSVDIRGYGLIIRLRNLTGGKYAHVFNKIDRYLFTFFPRLQYFCRTVLVEYKK